MFGTHQAKCPAVLLAGCGAEAAYRPSFEAFTDQHVSVIDNHLFRNGVSFPRLEIRQAPHESNRTRNGANEKHENARFFGRLWARKIPPCQQKISGNWRRHAVLRWGMKRPSVSIPRSSSVRSPVKRLGGIGAKWTGSASFPYRSFTFSRAVAARNRQSDLVVASTSFGAAHLGFSFNLPRSRSSGADERGGGGGRSRLVVSGFRKAVAFSLENWKK